MKVCRQRSFGHIAPLLRAGVGNAHPLHPVLFRARIRAFRHLTTAGGHSLLIAPRRRPGSPAWIRGCVARWRMTARLDLSCRQRTAISLENTGGWRSCTVWTAGTTSRSCRTGRCRACGTTGTHTVRPQRALRIFPSRTGLRCGAFTSRLRLQMTRSLPGGVSGVKVSASK